LLRPVASKYTAEERQGSPYRQQASILYCNTKFIDPFLANLQQNLETVAAEKNTIKLVEKKKFTQEDFVNAQKLLISEVKYEFIYLCSFILFNIRYWSNP
jgi:hypothetical protein